MTSADGGDSKGDGDDESGDDISIVEGEGE